MGIFLTMGNAGFISSTVGRRECFSALAELSSNAGSSGSVDGVSCRIQPARPLVGSSYMGAVGFLLT